MDVMYDVRAVQQICQKYDKLVAKRADTRLEFKGLETTLQAMEQPLSLWKAQERAWIATVMSGVWTSSLDNPYNARADSGKNPTFEYITLMFTSKLQLRRP